MKNFAHIDQFKYLREQEESSDEDEVLHNFSNLANMLRKNSLKKKLSLHADDCVDAQLHLEEKKILTDEEKQFNKFKHQCNHTIEHLRTQISFVITKYIINIEKNYKKVTKLEKENF